MKFLLTNAKSNNLGLELFETDIGSTHSALKLLSDKPLLDWKSKGNRFIAFGMLSVCVILSVLSIAQPHQRV